MSEKRRALGRGLGALIPSAPPAPTSSRPVDVFFTDQRPVGEQAEAPDGAVTDGAHHGEQPSRNGVT